MSSRSIQVVLNGRILQSVALDRALLTIGRGLENDIVIDNLAVSRQHAKILIEGTEMTLEDQKSENGTFVNGKRIERAILAPNDEIVIGKHHLVLSDEASVSVAVESERLILHDAPASAPRNAFLALRQHGSLLKTIAWDKPLLTIGRSPDCDIILEQPQISRRHAILTLKDGEFIVEDLDTGNGTLVNGTRKKREVLSDGDRLTLGDFELTFGLSAPAPEKLRDDKQLGTSFAVQDLHVQMQLAEIEGRIVEPHRPTPTESLGPGDYREIEFDVEAADKEAALELEIEPELKPEPEVESEPEPQPESKPEVAFEPEAAPEPAPAAPTPPPALPDSLTFCVTVAVKDLPEEQRRQLAEFLSSGITFPAHIRLGNKT